MFWPLFWLAVGFGAASCFLAAAFCTRGTGDSLIIAGMVCCFLGIVAAMVSEQLYS
jgi:hypothetical protein